MQPAHHEPEWLTRKARINAALAAAGWTVLPWSADLVPEALAAHAVEELPTDSGPADYALFVAGRLLGILEAKKIGVGPQNVLEQAKRYARGATALGPGDWDGLRVPFLYASNGHTIWHLDARDSAPASRRLAQFHTPTALAERWAAAPADCAAWFASHPPELNTRLRQYQVRAINAIEAQLASHRRTMLMAMATGTGKTFLTVSQVYRLLEAKAASRILFLVDRKALAAQAVREFNAFATPHGHKFPQEYEVFSQRFRREDFGEDEPFDPKVLPAEYLVAPKPSHTFVYVSTIQRMARNLFGAEHGFVQPADDAEREDDDSDRLDIPVHAFDLIVADECHRGYTAQEESLWRSTLDHFDAVKIGLTATPAAHTTAYFGAPVFRYGIEQAIDDGHLVDWDAVKITSGVRLNGVFLREGEHVVRVDPATGAETFDELEDERQFSSAEIERAITAPDSNRKIVEEIARHAAAHERATGRFPKILIFAVNDLPHTSHADQLVRLCRDVFGQGDAFVQKITGSPSVDRPLQRIREFRNRPAPKVVVTVDMLSTGVDIPALEFIVFLRPVKSRILWEQMLGRGTRRCPEIAKSHFVVFDCFDGTLIRYFRGATAMATAEPAKAGVTLPELVDRIWQNTDRDYSVRCLVKRLHRIEKDMSGRARTEFAKWIPEGDMGRYAAGLTEALRRDFSGTMRLLRTPDFLDLLQNYERAKSTFLVAHAVEDTVSSAPVERYGPFEKAEDYLAAFDRFVAENRAKIEALGVLFQRPADWRPEVLDSLRTALMQHQFPEHTLQRAHARASHKQLADIISIVKHAAAREAPLLSAEERVQRALDAIVPDPVFTAEQRQWLGLIREHLVGSLSLGEDDFDLQPLFARRGGLARARKLFRDQLPALVQRINAAVAA